MAAVVAPARVSAKHQSLLHLVGQAAWSDEAVLAKVRELVLPAIEAQGKIEAWIVDDTGFAAAPQQIPKGQYHNGQQGEARDGPSTRKIRPAAPLDRRLAVRQHQQTDLRAPQPKSDGVGPESQSLPSYLKETFTLVR